MEILLLGIYSFFVWLIFIKFKWLPWNITTQVIAATIPVIGITVLILFLNVVAPSSADMRIMNYVAPINSRVEGITGTALRRGSSPCPPAGRATARPPSFPSRRRPRW